MAAVSSVVEESTTITSKSSNVWARRDATHSPMVSCEFQAGRMTETLNIPMNRKLAKQELFPAGTGAEQVARAFATGGVTVDCDQYREACDETRPQPRS